MRWHNIVFAIIILGSFLVKLFFLDATVQSDGNTYYDLSVAWAKTNSFEIDKEIYLHNLGFPLMQGMLYRAIEPTYYIHTILTMTYSCLALIPAYFFLRCFIPVKYALLGLSLLAFDYRLVINSTLGITEPLFLLLAWSACALSLRTDRWALLSIPVVIMAVLVRFEGIVFFLFVGYVFISRSKYLYVIPWVFGSLCFHATSLFKLNVVEKSQKAAKVFGLVESHAVREIKSVMGWNLENTFPILNGIVYFGWSLFPNYIFLVPLGFLAVLKKQIGKSVLVWIALFAGTGIYAYIDAYDTRYFFNSFLFVVLFGLVGLRWLLTVRCK